MTLTIPETREEVIDALIEDFRRDPRFGFFENSCVYMTPDKKPTGCAIGRFIPEDVYDVIGVLIEATSASEAFETMCYPPDEEGMLPPHGPACELSAQFEAVAEGRWWNDVQQIHDAHASLGHYKRKGDYCTYEFVETDGTVEGMIASYESWRAAGFPLWSALSVESRREWNIRARECGIADYVLRVLTGEWGEITAPALQEEA